MRPEQYNPLQVFTVAELAEQLRTSYDTALDMIHQGKIKSFKPFPKAKEHRIPARSLFDYLYPEDAGE